MLNRLALLVIPLMFVSNALFAQPVHEPETILFMGSSSIANWQRTMKEQFPAFHTVAVSRGGSDLPWLIGVAEAALIEHKPHRIVIYSGDNDLAKGMSPEIIFGNFKHLIALIRTLQSETPVYIISIKPSPGRRDLLEKVKATNALLREATAHLPKLTYVDVYSKMISKSGEIDERNFDEKDATHIHLSPAGYNLWTTELTERLRSL